MSALQTTSANQTIEFSCDSCGGRLTVPVAYAGVEGPCPKCGELVCSPSAVPELPSGVAEFIPLNRSNLAEEEELPAEETGGRRKSKRSGLPERGKRTVFVAKQKIAAEWEKDEAWRQEFREGAKKWSRSRRIQRKLAGIVDSSRLQAAGEIFAPVAIFTVVGVVIFMKLNGWGLKGNEGVSKRDVPAESQGQALAELATVVGGGGEAEPEADESSNLAAFERVRAASANAEAEPAEER